MQQYKLRFCAIGDLINNIATPFQFNSKSTAQNSKFTTKILLVLHQIISSIFIITSSLQSPQININQSKWHQYQHQPNTNQSSQAINPSVKPALSLASCMISSIPLIRSKHTSSLHSFNQIIISFCLIFRLNRRSDCFELHSRFYVCSIQICCFS